MMVDRRDVMGAALGGAALAGTQEAAAAPRGDAPKLTHHVFFWLKDHGSAKDRDALIAGLRTLAAIPVIRRLHIGVPADTEARDVVDGSYDVSELMFFDTTADQKAYQDHPIHQAFVAQCSHLWRKVVVYDTLTV